MSLPSPLPVTVGAPRRRGLERARSEGPRHSWGWRLGWALGALVPLAFLAVFFAWPVVGLVARGFFDETGFTLDGFVEVGSAPRTWRIIRQTLTQAFWGTALSVLLGVPAAQLLYRTRFRGQLLLRGIVAVPFVLPSVVVGVAFRSLFASNGPLGFLGLAETQVAIVAALVFFNFSVVVRTVGVMWARLDARQVQAAQTLGASPTRAFLTVTLPALAPAIASAASIVFLFCASAFGVVMVLGGVRYGTIETEIWFQTTQLLNLPAAAALSILQLVLVSGLLVVTNRLQRRTEATLRMRADLGALPLWSWRQHGLSTLLTGLVIGGLLGLPMLHLLVASLRGPSGWGVANYLNLANTTAGFSVPVTRAIANSLWIATLATLICLVLGSAVALVASRRPRSASGRTALAVTESVFMLPLGISAVTVGFGYLITLNRPPFDLRSSMILVPLAQALVALPLVVRSMLPVLRAIAPEQREAAQMLGAGPGRVLASIDLAYLSRTLGVAAGFAFATSLGEFGATSFLTRPDNPTLPVVIFRLISRPGAENFGMAMAASVVLAVLTAVVMMSAEKLRWQEGTSW